MSLKEDLLALRDELKHNGECYDTKTVAIYYVIERIDGILEENTEN